MKLALRRRRSAALPMSEDDIRAVWQCASLLIGYPDDELRGRLPLLGDVAARLPKAAGAPLQRLIGDLAASDPETVRREYVETFDYTRRCAPYLTYFAYGDTRKRGVALVQFKQAYRHAGAELRDADAELPDHLAIVLEFGSGVDLHAGLKLVLDHRAGVEVLRLALQDAESRWADAIAAVCATLPPLEGDEHAAVARLIELGPPNEEVGLAPYAIDPRLNPDPAADDPWSSQGRSGQGVPGQGGQGQGLVEAIRPAASRQAHPLSSALTRPTSASPSEGAPA